MTLIRPNTSLWIQDRPYEIRQRVHSGPHFEVYSGLNQDGDLVAVKVPTRSAQQRHGLGVIRYDCISVTGLYSFTGNWLPTRSLIPRLLAAEAEKLEAFGTEWNHELLDYGLVTGSSHPLIEAGDPAMVSPWHPGTAFRDLLYPERRYWLTACLPSLWNALSGRGHGDVHVGNLILSEDRTRFHLLDPGVVVDLTAEEIRRWWQESTSYDGSATPRYYGKGSRAGFMTTNRANYPLFCPSFDHPYADGHGTIDAAIEDFVDWWGAARRSRIYGESSGRSWNGVLSPSHRPLLSDLLALGILYFQGLFNFHPFPGYCHFGVPTDASITEAPAWFGDQGDPDFVRSNLYQNNMANVAGGLSGGWHEPANYRSIHEPARRLELELSMDLLNMKIHSYDQLHERCEAILHYSQV